MAYKLQITDHVENDLDVILSYLMTQPCNMEAVLHLVDNVSHHYALLLQNPYLHEQCQQALLQKHGYRKVVIGGYLMVYRVDEMTKSIYIERFFSDLQDYAAKL